MTNMHIIPEKLRTAYIEKKLIPIVGAGVSMSLRRTDGNQLFPSWRGLLLNAANKLKKEGKDAEAAGIAAMLPLNLYKEAATVARKGLLGNLWSNFFYENFAVNYEEIDVESLLLPKAVWELSNRVITLNYDKVLRITCPDNGVTELDNTSNSGLASFLRGENPGHVIWHLHGRLDNLDHIIFTSEAYEKLYVEQTSQYKAALSSLQAVCRDFHLLFVGCSLDDAELLAELNNQSTIFKNNVGPHYALIHKDNEAQIKERLKSVPNIEPIVFEDFGAPLIDVINAIKSSTLPKSTEIRITNDSHSQIGFNHQLASTKSNKRAAVLIAQPIDKDFQYDEILKEIRKLKCDIHHLYLSTNSLNELEGFDYIFILTKLTNNNLSVEDEALRSSRISLKELEENIGNSNTKGIFIFLNYTNIDEVDFKDKGTLNEPIILFPELSKSELDSLFFKIFKKQNLDLLANATIINKDRFKLGELHGITKNIKKHTPLPDEIDPRSTYGFVGRNTDLETISRYVLKIRDKNEFLTIKGSGGIGKTATVKKIAVELSLRNFFSSGIYFLACEFIPDHKTFESSVARSFNLENALNIKQQLKENYCKEDKLIVLDNVETLLHLEDTPLILDFITFVSEFATIVITSRELTNLVNEQVYELRPFTTDEAFNLFMQELSWCSKLKTSERELIRQNILENLLDNNPLAIKLVTKNIPKGKSFEALKEELETDIFNKVSDLELEAFDNVSDVNIQRKKSLYASINFSYQHLNEKEKMTFELLSLFPAGINMEHFKKMTEINNSNTKKNKKEPLINETFLITDPIIKSLENKSIIQIDNNLIKLQSIVGRFADVQFGKRTKEDLAKYYKNAFEYNRAMCSGLNILSNDDYFLAAEIFNRYQNNFIKSFEYLATIDTEIERLLLYIETLGRLTTAISAMRRFGNILDNVQLDFRNEQEKLAFDLLKLKNKYYDGDFAKTYARLNEMVPISEVNNYFKEDQVNRMIARSALQIYIFEGETLSCLKCVINKNIYTSDYPLDLFQLGIFNSDLIKTSNVDFSLLEVLYAQEILTPAQINTYSESIYEKSHLEIANITYIKVKMGLADNQTIKRLVSVNPYTEGLKNLMYALNESNVEKKTQFFDRALIGLEHIKYYYVEGLYFYARFLKETSEYDQYTKIFNKGNDLARKYSYRYLMHKFDDLSFGVSTKYDQHKYMLPENPPIEEHIQNILKDRSNTKKPTRTIASIT